MRSKKFIESRNGTTSSTTNGRNIISTLCVLCGIKTNRFIKDKKKIVSL